MTKSQLTLLLGVISLAVPCIPCVGTSLYMVIFLVTLILGVLAHQDTETNDQVLAKVGMVTGALPLVACVIFFVGYVLLIVLSMVLGAVGEMVS